MPINIDLIPELHQRVWYYAWSNEEPHLIIAQLWRFTEQLYWSHNPCVTDHVFVVITKEFHIGVSGKIVGTGLIFFMCLFSADLLCQFFIFHFVLFIISIWIYKCCRNRCKQIEFIQEIICVGTSVGSSRGTLFSLVPVSACFPPTTQYAHCTSVLTLHGLALSVVKYSSIRVGSSDFLTVVIIRFN